MQVTHFQDIIRAGTLNIDGPAIRLAEMPEAFRKLQAQLLRRPGGDREMIDVLALMLQHDEQAVLCAVELALESGIATKTHVLNLLHRLTDARGTTAIIDAPQALVPTQEPRADISATTRCKTGRCAMRHDPASAALVVTLRGLKMYGMAQAVGDLAEQGAPAFASVIPTLPQLLKAEPAEREVRSIAYHIKSARFRGHVMAAERLHGDDTTVPVLAKGKTSSGRLSTYVRDDHRFAGTAPPAAMFHYSPDC